MKQNKRARAAAILTREAAKLTRAATVARRRAVLATLRAAGRGRGRAASGAENKVVSEFLAACTVPAPGRIRSRPVWEAFEAWTEQGNGSGLGRTCFYRVLRERGIYHARGGVLWCFGIELAPGSTDWRPF